MFGDENCILFATLHAVNNGAAPRVVAAFLVTPAFRWFRLVVRTASRAFFPRRVFGPARCFEGVAFRAFSDAIPKVQKCVRLVDLETC